MLPKHCSYANGIRVSIIDGKADQILTTTGISTVGMGTTQSVANRVVGAAKVYLTDTLKVLLLEFLKQKSRSQSIITRFCGTVTQVDYQAMVYIASKQMKS